MKILLIDNKSIGAPNLAHAMRQKGWQVEAMQTDINGRRRIPELEEQLEQKIKQNGYDYLVSFNFYPVLAEVCYVCGLRYISWVYDSPLVALYSYTMVYDTNYVFLFDYAMYEELKKIGLPRVFYMPLASNTWKSPFASQMTVNNYPKMPITFVGSLYNEKKNDLYSKFEGISDYARGYLDALVYAQKSIYGADIIKGNLIKSIVDEIKRVVPYGDTQKDGVETDTYIYEEYFLNRRVTALERIEILQRLSNNHDVYLFSGRKPDGIDNIHFMGMTDYYLEMPGVFRQSDINLNITLRSIKTGIPARILDIMGVGGFVLTNYQAEMEEYFRSGEHYDYYEDIQDLEEKVDFYLCHPEIRDRIARNGQGIIDKNFTYENRLDEIFRIVNEN